MSSGTLEWSLDCNLGQAQVNNAWLSLTYLDQGTGVIYINIFHDYEPGVYDTSYLCLTNTGKWVTRVIPFDRTYIEPGGMGLRFLDDLVNFHRHISTATEFRHSHRV